jgi:aminoglycoside 3-N-acetyltransferase I
MEIRRLRPGDEKSAHEMCAMMAAVFEEDRDALSDDYVRALLKREDFWAVVATDAGSVVGGITAYTLPLTRSPVAELFIYDLAVVADRQRMGIGRALLTELLSLAATAGINASFVAADNEDTHALDFYRALGGDASPVTLFTFSY